MHRLRCESDERKFTFITGITNREHVRTYLIISNMIPQHLTQNSTLRVNGEFDENLYNRRCYQDETLMKFKNEEKLTKDEAAHIFDEFGILDACNKFYSLRTMDGKLQPEDKKLLMSHPDYPTSIGCRNWVYDDTEIACSPCHFRHYNSQTICTPVYCQTRIQGKPTGVSPILCTHNSRKEIFVPVVPGGLERKYQQRALKERVAVRNVEMEITYAYGCIPIYSEEVQRGPVIQAISNEDFIAQVNGPPPQEM
jgi:hypothetical protein